MIDDAPLRIVSVLGVDPGSSSGAVCRLDFERDTGLIVGFDCIRISKSTWHEVASTLGEWMRSKTVARAVVEKVGAMPRQGVSSSFKFGYGAGLLYGVLLAHRIPVDFVTPQRWQKALSVQNRGKKSKTEHKRLLKERAQARFPASGIVNENADAYLIALYALSAYQPKTRDDA